MLSARMPVKAKSKADLLNSATFETGVNSVDPLTRARHLPLNYKSQNLHKFSLETKKRHQKGIDAMSGKIYKQQVAAQMMSHKSEVNLRNRKTAYSPYDAKRRETERDNEYQDVTVPSTLEIGTLRTKSSRNSPAKERPNSTVQILQMVR